MIDIKGWRPVHINDVNNKDNKTVDPNIVLVVSYLYSYNPFTTRMIIVNNTQ